MNITQKLILASLLSCAATLTSAAIKEGQAYGDWKGVCQEKECGIIQLVNNQNNMPVGRIVLRKLPQTGNTPVMIVTVPLGVNLHAGLGMAVDNKEILKAPFDFCDPSGCNVAIPLAGDKISALQKGNKLHVAAFIGDEQQMMEFSLKGITNAIKAL